MSIEFLLPLIDDRSGLIKTVVKTNLFKFCSRSARVLLENSENALICVAILFSFQKLTIFLSSDFRGIINSFVKIKTH